jgi:hypothetical protein
MAHRRGRGKSRRLDWLAVQRLSYSVGFALPATTAQLLERIPASVWAPAYNGVWA